MDSRTISPATLTRTHAVDPQRGLSATEAADRLAEGGANRLVDEPPRSRWLLFADQFKSLLILILVVAAALGALVGDIKDVVVIGVVIVLNATLGYYQRRSERRRRWQRSSECLP